MIVAFGADPQRHFYGLGFFAGFLRDGKEN